jgi:hypothetical protein
MFLKSSAEDVPRCATAQMLSAALVTSVIISTASLCTTGMYDSTPLRMSARVAA